MKPSSSARPEFYSKLSYGRKTTRGLFEGFAIQMTWPKKMHIPLFCLEFASFQPIDWVGRIHLWIFATEFSIEQILQVSFWVVTCGEGQGSWAPRGAAAAHLPPALVFLLSFPGGCIASERKAQGQPIPPEFLSCLWTSDSYNLLSKLPGTSRQTQSLCFPLPLKGESI